MNRKDILQQEFRYFKKDIRIINTHDPIMFFLGVVYFGIIFSIVYGIVTGFRIVVGR